MTCLRAFSVSVFSCSSSKSSRLNRGVAYTASRGSRAPPLVTRGFTVGGGAMALCGGTSTPPRWAHPVLCGVRHALHAEALAVGSDDVITGALGSALPAHYGVRRVHRRAALRPRACGRRVGSEAQPGAWSPCPPAGSRESPSPLHLALRARHRPSAAPSHAARAQAAATWQSRWHTAAHTQWLQLGTASLLWQRGAERPPWCARAPSATRRAIGAAVPRVGSG